LGWKSTVSSSIEPTISMAAAVSRASVYRMAAGGSSPPWEPKLPCPSTIGSRIANGWAIRTSAS
jgi:hypothetical protein